MERFLVKKDPKPKPEKEAAEATAQALEKRRAVALPSKLVQLFPVIADFCDTGTLLDWLSCYRPDDEDRRIIEAGFSGSIKLPAIRYVNRRKLHRSVPLQFLRALSRTSDLTLDLRSTSRDGSFRAFRLALMTEKLACLEKLTIYTDARPSVMVPFWLDVPPSLKSLGSLKFLRIYVGSAFFKDNEPTLLTAMASMRSLEDFDEGFAWTSSLIATFLKLKWPALKVLRSDHFLMETPPVPAVPNHEQLLASAFANGHFPRVSHLVVGESLAGNLYDALPKDGLKQIKTLTLVGRILRSPLLNFRTLPPGELNLNGTGGTIYRSLFSGLECLDVSHLHVPDVMPFFHAANEQAIYCDAFHRNSLRALANLATVVGASKLKKVMISDLFVSGSSEDLAAGQFAMLRMLECRAEIAAARLSTLSSLVKGVKVLDVSLSPTNGDFYQGKQIYEPSQDDVDEEINDEDDFQPDPSCGAIGDDRVNEIESLAKFLSECKDLHERVEELLLPCWFFDSFQSYHGRLRQVLFHKWLPDTEIAFDLMRSRVEDLERAIDDYDSGLDQSCHREDLEQKLERARGILDAFECWRCRKDGSVSYLFPNEEESRDILEKIDKEIDRLKHKYPYSSTSSSLIVAQFDRTTFSGFKALRSLVLKPDNLSEWDDDYNEDEEWLDLRKALRSLPPCCTSLTLNKFGPSNRLHVYPSIKEFSKPSGKGLITHYFKHVNEEHEKTATEKVVQLKLTTKGSTQPATEMAIFLRV